MAGRKAATKSKKTSAKRTTGTAYKGFSAEERAAMKGASPRAEGRGALEEGQGGRGKGRAR